jgi:hypothetical protein
MIQTSKIRRLLVLGLLVWAFVFVYSGNTLAVDVLTDACSGPAAGSPLCQGEDTPVYGEQGVLTRVAQLIIQIVGAASIIMITVGGFKYVTSNGDPNKIASAKSTVIYALIGLVVAVLSQAIILVVLRRI